MWTESVWCEFWPKKVSKLHPIGQIWQCYLTNFPAEYESSPCQQWPPPLPEPATELQWLCTGILLVFIWFEIEILSLLERICDGKVKAESAGLGQVLKILYFFLSNGKAAASWTAWNNFVLTIFFYRETATNLRSRYSGKTQQIVHRFRLFTIILVQLQQSHPFLTTNNGFAPVFFWSSFDLKSSFRAFSNGFVMEKSKQKVPA